MTEKKVITTVDVAVCQINTKRQWKFPARRMVKMLHTAGHAGATILTLNEISKRQALAIRKLPGWDIHWEINNRLRGGSWEGNAIAWKTSVWHLDEGWNQPTSIDYRTGRLRDRKMGPWRKKRTNQACTRLKSKKIDGFKVLVQAFHYPTNFNSNEASRVKCAKRTAKFAAYRIKRGIPVIASGDGNNVFPKRKGLNMIHRNGPDAVTSNGYALKSHVFLFKKQKLTDHNGILSVIRFNHKVKEAVR